MQQLSRFISLFTSLLVGLLLTAPLHAKSKNARADQAVKPFSEVQSKTTGPVIDMGYGVSMIAHGDHFLPLSHLNQKHWGESMNISIAYRYSPYFLAGFGRSFIPWQYASTDSSSQNARYIAWYGYLETDLPLIWGAKLIAQGGMGSIKAYDVRYIDQFGSLHPVSIADARTYEGAVVLPKREIKPYLSLGLSLPVTEQFNIRLNAARFVVSDSIVHDYLMNYFVSFNYMFS